MISEIVDVNISIEDTAVSQAGFGVGLVVGSSDRLSSKVQEFASAAAAAEVYEDGDPELKMIQQYFGQEIQPTRVIAAQRDADQAEKIKITIPTLANAVDYSVTISIDGASGVLNTFTSDGDATREEIVDGLVALIEADFPDTLTLTDNGDDFDIASAVAGDGLSITLSVNLAQQTVTAHRNLSTELAEILQLNNEWYCLLSASHLDKDIKRGAAFVQANAKVYIPSSQNADIISPEAHVGTLDFDADFVTSNTIDLTIDGIPVDQTTFSSDQATTIAALASNIQAHPAVATATVTDTNQITVTAEENDQLMVFTAIVVAAGASQASGAFTTTVDPTTDLGAELEALGYDRTALMYSGTADSVYPEAAWAGLLLPENPGSITWFAKTLTGVAADSLTATQKAKALGNNVNTYTSVGGVSIMQNGTMASGRFIDIRRGVDWVKSRIETLVYSRIVNAKKIPYTNAGVAIIENEIRFALNEAVNNDVLAADPAPTVTAPNVLDVASADRANRLLPNVSFTGRLAGAIHEVDINGTVSV